MKHKALKIILILPIFIFSILGGHLLISNPKIPLNNLFTKYDISLSSTAVNLVWSYNFGENVDKVEVSKDGQFITVASNSKLYLLNLTDKHMWNYSFAAQIRDIAISDDGKYIISGISDVSVTMFNHTGHMWDHSINNLVYSVDISKDGEFAVAGTAEHYVTLFYRNGSVKWNYDTGYTVGYVSMSADGQYIASGDFGTNLTLFNNTDKVMWNHNMTRAAPVAISKNGQFIVSGNQYIKNVSLFNINDGDNYVWSHNITLAPWYVDISDDGRYIAVGGINYPGPPKAGNITLFNNETGFIWFFNVGAVDLLDVAISGDGNYIVAGDSSGILHLFNRNGRIWNTNLSSNVDSVAISQNGRYIFAVAGNNLYVYNNPKPSSPQNPLAMFIALQGMESGSQIIILTIVLIICIGAVLVVIYLYYTRK
ncbi:MAG: WD40 repeat domain-containing protein [Promethearchaeota archaeon]